MGKKLCAICGKKRGILGWDLADDEYMCSSCFSTLKENSGIKNLETVTTRIHSQLAKQVLEGDIEKAEELWELLDVSLDGREVLRNKNQSENIIIVSTDFITDKKLQTIGLVTGSKFTMASVSDSDIDIAIKSLRQNAAHLGADAIINFHYAPSTRHAYVWGTAVKFITITETPAHLTE